MTTWTERIPVARKVAQRIPYTYLVGWEKLNKFYYGMRTARNCHPKELWKTYFTSSKEVKLLRKLFGDPDIIEVRRVFIDPNKCCAWEAKVLRRIKASFNEKFLNRHNGGEKFNTIGRSQSAAYYKAKCKNYVVMDPDGEITYVVGLKAFCKSVGVCDAPMYNVAKGNSKSHAGWQCRYYDDITPFYNPKDAIREFKSGYRVLSPSGIEHFTDNMSAFCLEHNLHSGSMIASAQGIKLSHHGWQCKYANDSSQFTDPSSLTVLYKGDYLLVSPDGKQHTVNNLKDFCKDHGLRKNHIHSVCNGKLISHKQWRAYHV